MKKTALRPYDLRFRRLKGGPVLLSNDSGAAAVLSGPVFNKFVSGSLNSDGGVLAARGFARNRLDMEAEAAHLAGRFFSGWRGPHVHIISLSARCNLSCSYCSAGANTGGGRRMTRAVAEKTLDFIFSLPSPKLLLEFQGG